jgi:hypothetical protein
VGVTSLQELDFSNVWIESYSLISAISHAWQIQQQHPMDGPYSSTAPIPAQPSCTIALPLKSRVSQSPGLCDLASCSACCGQNSACTCICYIHAHAWKPCYPSMWGACCKGGQDLSRPIFHGESEYLCAAP